MDVGIVIVGVAFTSGRVPSIQDCAEHWDTVGNQSLFRAKRHVPGSCPRTDYQDRAIREPAHKPGVGQIGNRRRIQKNRIELLAQPLQQRSEDEAITVALRALDTAAESDTATGGVDRSGKIYPLIKIVSRDGIRTLPEEKIAAVFEETVA